VSDRLAVLTQYLLPKQALTGLAGKAANAKWGNVTTKFIAWFVGKYQVNMSEAANSDITSYATFNEFFTRPLKTGARPIANSDLVCPVDGAISQFGPISQGHIFQAKGHHFSATALIGGDSEAAAEYANGSFANIYLSPRDYHRIHMPCDGKLAKMVYVPGDLFSVNPTTARGVPNLFARNERLVCFFESASGNFVMTLVGATIVGSMATVWHGIINPPRAGKVRTWNYKDKNIHLKKGEEMGRFMLGSTVVLLFPHSNLRFNAVWKPAGSVKLGEVMADYSCKN